MKKAIGIFLFLSLLFPIERVCHFLTDGFYEQRIITDLPNREEWEVPIPPPERALNQPYYYLGCGGQSFVFESEDRQFVLKFFKHHRWRKDRFFFRSQHMGERLECREKTLMSAVYAAKYFQEESRIKYVHLNRGGNHLPKITFIDRMKRKHHLNLNEYQFVIQEKGVILKERLLKRRKKGDFEGAKEDVSRCIELLKKCYAKGIKNNDPYMTRNFGFVGDDPVVIDSGALCEYQEEGGEPLSQEELRKSVRHLVKWAEEHYPSLAQYIKASVQ